MKNFSQYFERVNITKPSKGSKKVFADNVPLKNIPYSEATNNILIYYEAKGNFFIPAGKFYVYFLDTTENVKKMAKGEIDFVFFPFRRRFDMTASPITDIWKKSYAKDRKGAEHILGIVEGQVYEEDKVYEIQMMSVRPGFKENKINTFLVTEVVEYMKNRFPDFKLAFEDPTEDGLNFIAKFDPTALIYWTHNHRPKNWQTLQNVLTNFKNLKEGVISKFNDFQIE